MAQMPNIALYTPRTRPFLLNTHEGKKQDLSVKISLIRRSLEHVSQRRGQGRSYRIASHMLSHTSKDPSVSK